ncbi:MAG: hypothetical protein UR89_C0004G0025 [Candidatus Roizmanbacteria bacterium GW2011_GWA2_35_8]|uniref:HD domain-containing protein n=1 Tax=Candidatus Roizmanbacteria bacterium GW2011_GWA2_35_8 TaxID=1618479 RepID=A0A0G0DF40_9BACT|nr:MAG: hypothetical protein UR89_C0004G0025 [Candidatus Roizmanbacteria bacterium GW2011_GWA2_35_8]
MNYTDSISKFFSEYEKKKIVLMSYRTVNQWKKELLVFNDKYRLLTKKDVDYLAEIYVKLSIIKRWRNNPFLSDRRKDNVSSHSYMFAFVIKNLFDNLIFIKPNKVSLLLIKKALIHDIGEYRGELLTYAEKIQGKLLSDKYKSIIESKRAASLIKNIAFKDFLWVKKWIYIYGQYPIGSYWRNFFKLFDRLESEIHSVYFSDNNRSLNTIRKMFKLNKSVKNSEVINIYKNRLLSMCHDPYIKMRAGFLQDKNLKSIKEKINDATFYFVDFITKMQLNHFLLIKYNYENRSGCDFNHQKK